MKLVKIILKTTLLLFVVIFSSCKDDSTNPSNTNNNSSSENNEWVPGTDLGNPLKSFKENSSTLITATIHKMIEYKNELYVGGEFEVIGGKIIPYLAKWDGAQWSSIGTINGPVNDMIVFKQKLLIQVDEVESHQSVYRYNKVLSWDGLSLNEMNINIDGVNKPFYAVAPFSTSNDNNKERWHVFDDKLFVFAKYKEFSGDDCALFWWDGGQNWDTDADFNMYHGIFQSYQGKLYCTANGWQENSGLWRFNGDFDMPQQSNGWEKVSGETLNDPLIQTATVYNNKLIIGGYFSTISGETFNNIAAFNGTSWSSVGGCNGWDEIIELNVFNDNLYCASGYLPGSCIDDYRIGFFDGKNWTGSDHNLIDFGFIGGQGKIITMHQFNNQLFLAGNNITAGCNNFLKLK